MHPRDAAQNRAQDELVVVEGGASGKSNRTFAHPGRPSGREFDSRWGSTADQGPGPMHRSTRLGDAPAAPAESMLLASGLVDHAGDGLLLVDAQGRDNYHNAAAADLLAGGYLLEHDGSGRVRMAPADWRDEWSAALSAAFEHARATILDICLPCRPRYRLSVHAAAARQGRPLALIRLRNLDFAVERLARAAHATFDLTEAERRLLIGLLNGQQPAIYAERVGLRITTVRSQLRTLFAKAGAARQSDLMLRVQTLDLPF